MPRKELPESPAIHSYAKWRPRLRRSATWAGLAAVLAKNLGNTGRKTLIVPTVTAGLAGLGDAIIEDKLREHKSQKAQALAARAFEEKQIMPKFSSAEDPSLFPSAAVEAARVELDPTLFGFMRQKNELRRRAISQLQDLFPSTGEQHFGHGVRMTTGYGHLKSLLAPRTSEK